MRLGAHLPAQGNLVRFLRTAADLGCEAAQVFSRSPRGGRPRELPAAETKEARAFMMEAGIRPLVIHVPYLVNLASERAEVRQYSLEVLVEDLCRAEAMGAAYLVTHAGSGGAAAPADALARAGAGLRAAVERYRGPVRLVVENQAGEGSEVAWRMEDLAALCAAAGEVARERVGVCLDTCHAFAAGYELAGGGAAALLDGIDALAGPGRLCVIHANDSRHARGSRRDRHEHIGAGAIGAAGFLALCAALRARPGGGDVPLILETPFEKPEDLVPDLETLRRLRSEAG